MSAGFGDIAAIIESPINKAVLLTDAFVPMSHVFLSLSVCIAATFAIYEWWLDGASAGVARLVRAGFGLMFALYLLVGGNWIETSKTIANFFANELPAPILKADGSSSGADSIRQAINKLSASMFPGERNQDERSVLQKASDILDKGPAEYVGSKLTEAFVQLILFALHVVISAALVFAMYGPLLALHVGLVFGPLLIAWLPWRPMSHLAKNWFQFILATGFAIPVGVFLASLCSSSIAEFSDQMATIGRDPSISFHEELMIKLGGLATVGAAGLFMAWQLFKADNIAAAMIGGGGAGTSSVGAVIMNKIVPRGNKGGDKPKPGGGDK